MTGLVLPERPDDRWSAGIAPASSGWSALLLAGRRPGTDPLAEWFGVSSKALVPIGGEPMLNRVLKILLEVDRIERIVVLSQEGRHLMLEPGLEWLEGCVKVSFFTAGPTISGSLASCMEGEAGRRPVLVTTADNVLLLPEIVEFFLREAGHAQLSVGLVSREQMEADCGRSRRTWWRFRDGDFAGANLFAFSARHPDLVELLKFWEGVEGDRKKALRIAARFGPVLLLRFLCRRLTLSQAFAGVGRRFRIEARAVRLPFGRAAIDVDDLADHRKAEIILGC